MQIYFLYKGGNSKPPMQYLASAGRVHTRDFLPLRYDSVLRRKRLPPGLYIFSDIEFLHGDLREQVIALHDRVTNAPGAYRVLNDPRQTFTRYPLLRTLHERGINDFNVHRADGDLSGVRFPVFLRVTNDHSGPRTGLLADRASLQGALQQVAEEGYDLGALLVTEFCDTSGEDGLYRKYSSLVFGESVVPRHMLVGSNWMLKVATEESLPEHIEEELDFMQSGSFEDQVREIFSMAGVEYGRIDFGVRHGRVQVWEINTNPLLLTVEHEKEGPRRAVHERFFRSYEALLDAVIGQPPRKRPGIAFLPDRVERIVRVCHEKRRDTRIGRFWENNQGRIKRFGRSPGRSFPDMGPGGGPAS